VISRGGRARALSLPYRRVSRRGPRRLQRVVRVGSTTADQATPELFGSAFAFHLARRAVAALTDAQTLLFNAGSSKPGRTAGPTTLAMLTAFFLRELGLVS
jgi:hypothetical protein